MVAVAGAALKGLLGTLFLIRESDRTPRPALSAVCSVVRAAQMLAFCFAPVFTSWQWAEGVRQASFSLQANAGALGASAATEAALMWAVVAWVSLFLALVAYASYAFVHGSFPALWPLAGLRAMGNASREILFIPIVSVLAHLAVVSDASNVGLIARSFCVWVLLLSFICFCSLLSLTCYENSLTSTSHFARAHGRLDFLRQLIRTALVLCINVYSASIPVDVLVGLLVAGATVELSATVFFSPYYSSRWNAWSSALSAAFWWMALTLAVSESIGGLPAAAACLSILPGALAGAYLSHVRLYCVIHASVDDVFTPYCVEIRTRVMLLDALAAARFVPAPGSAPEQAAAFRRAVGPEVLATAKAAYAAGIARFRASAILHVFASRFYRVLGQHHHQMIHLMQAERRHPLLDSLFEIYDARRTEDDGSQRSRLDAIQRLAIVQRLADVKQCMQRAAAIHQSFWAELAQSSPSLSHLSDLIGQSSGAEDKAEACFADLLVLDSRSVVILGLYAAFVEHILADVVRAASLRGEASRVDLEHSSVGLTNGGSMIVMARSPIDVDKLAPATAIVTIELEANGKGVVSFVNAGATHLFQCSRRDFEQRLFGSLLPEPLAGHLEGIMREFSRTGEEGLLAGSYMTFML